MKISGIYKGTVISDEELHQVEVFAKRNKLKIFIEKDFYNQKTNIYVVLRNIVYDIEGIDINNNYIIKELMNEFHFIQIGNSNKYRIERSIENLLVLSSSDDDDGIDYVNQQIQKIEDEKESQTKQLKKQFKKESKEKKNENNTEEKTEKRKRGRPKKK